MPHNRPHIISLTFWSDNTLYTVKLTQSFLEASNTNASTTFCSTGSTSENGCSSRKLSMLSEAKLVPSEQVLDVFLRSLSRLRCLYLARQQETHAPIRYAQHKHTQIYIFYLTNIN
mmetsp:Transcript_19623/g.32979  ORF Transcript_19623/g.32979 Transcript_19623/m.32979 type:complete len:116 (-) Transcript_19623:53-400(-)